MISVLLTVYKGEKYIKNALRSIFSQTYQKFEIIVIDEFGKDNVKNIIETYDNDKIKYFLKPDEGPGAAVKFGLERCTYDLVAIFEQDDYWFPKKLEKQIAVFLKNPETALVFTDWSQGIKISNEESMLQKYFRNIDFSNTFADLLKGNFIVASSAMFKKHIVEKTGFPNVEKIAQGPWDRQLWLRISKNHRVHAIKEILTWKYDSGNTLFFRSNYAKLQYYGWLEALNYFDKIEPESKRKIINNIGQSAFSSAKWYWYNDDYELFKKWMNITFKYKNSIKISIFDRLKLCLPIYVLRLIRNNIKHFRRLHDK